MRPPTLPRANETPRRPKLLVAFQRGLRRRCPRCGVGRLFRRFHILAERCEACGCELKPREGDCWGFLYVSMALLVGVLGVGAFFIRPADPIAGRIGMFAGALLVILGSLPLRKGLAIAFDIFIDPDREHRGPGPSSSEERRPEVGPRR